MKKKNFSFNVRFMRNLFVALCCGISMLLPTTGAAQTDITAAFTDDNFRNKVYEAIGKTAPEPIFDINVAGITSLDVSYSNISNLAGIEYFVALQGLDCNNNQLTALDVSGLTNLQSLICSYNQLTTLDVSGLTNLQSLMCPFNQLTTLDVSRLTNLHTLGCSINELTSLNVSGLTSLGRLGCSNNQLTTLDVSGLTNLQEFNCSYNNMVSTDDVTGWIEGKSWVFDPQNSVNSVTLDKASAIIALGTSLQLTATIEPDYATDKSVTWNSSDAAVATVTAEGLVSAAGAGSATITVTTHDGGLTASCEVTVVESATDITAAFTDDIFRNRVYELIDKTEPEPILDIDLRGITTLQFFGAGISNLSGIQYFVDLESLTCSYNNLTSLDVSGLTKLKFLNCSGNQLTSLNVSGLTNLITLECVSNELTALDVSESAILQTLSCSNNLLPVLDVSGLTSLGTLHCSNNILTELEVSELTDLYILYCSDNQLTALDVSRLTNLQYIECGYNQLTALDLSGLTNLQYIYCQYNHLTSLDVSGISNLYYFNCSYNDMITPDDVTGWDDDRWWTFYPQNSVESITLNKASAALLKSATLQLTASIEPAYSPKATTWSSSNEAVARVSAEGLVTAVSSGTATITVTAVKGGLTASCAVTVVDSARNITAEFVDENFRNKVYQVIGKTAPAPIWDTDLTGITSLYIPNSDIADLAGIHHFVDLQSLKCDENNLTTLDVSGLTNLQLLKCDENQMTSLNVSGLTNLQWLDCNDNQLTTLDVSGLTNLQMLDCAENQLTTLNLSGATNLTEMDCGRNQLTALDVSELTNLETLDCYTNQLTTLNVSGLTNLQGIHCEENQLTSLDVLSLTNLQRLSCEENQLTTLNVSGLTNLNSLNCIDNQLTSLDVSGLTGLRGLYCQSNQLTALDISGLTNLETLYCHYNQLTELNVSAPTYLYGLDCSYNNMLTTADVVGWIDDRGWVFDPQNTRAASVVLNRSAATLIVDSINRIKLTATVLPADASSQNVTWSSSNAAVATVDGEGWVTAVSSGTANIVVRTVDGGFTDTCAITVVIPVTGVSLNKTSATINIGATEYLAATVLPANASNKAVTWSSSNAAVAMVSDSGLVMAVSTGTATITVTTADGGRTATCAITVILPVTGVTLNKTSATINVGVTEQLTATVAPDSASIKAVTWSSSNAAVATVSANGLVRAVGPGTANITVTTASGGHTKTCAITVIQPVTGVTLNKTTATIAIDSTEQFTASVAPANANNRAVTWSSNNTSVATVSATGLVTAVSAGTASITVTTQEGEYTATCAVTVIQSVAVTGVRFDNSPTAVNVGANEQLRVSIAPENATNQNLTWSSNNTAVATVSVNGLVTAVSIGTAYIAVTTVDGGFTDTCAITVVQPVTGVALNKTTATVTIGANEQLAASVAPANATNKALTWSSSNAAVATVSDSGLVRAVSAGTANIVVRTADGGFTDSCTITVVQPVIPITGVTLNKTETTINVGATEQLTATVAPANATNQNVTWSISNEAVITVSASGLITAVSAGTALIAVTTDDGGYADTCVITVVLPATGVSLNKTAATIALGATEQLTATVVPANATNQNVTWSSSNETVATISVSGLITAVSPGTATVTVTTAEGGHTASCALTVEELSVNFTNIVLDEGEEIALYRNVRLRFTFSGGTPTHFRTAESTTALNSAAWKTYNATSLLHSFASSIHGYKTVYAQMKNSVGETEVRSAVILYKPEHPKHEIRGFTINEGAWSTASRSVTLNHSVINAEPTLYSASENPLLVGMEWLPYTALPQFTLSNGAGLKEVYFAVANAADTSDIVSAQIWLEDPATKANSETGTASALSVKLYPNPVETTATVEVDGGKGKVQVSVYDVSGRMYLSRTFDTQTFSLDLTDYPSGILLVRIVNNGNSVIKKVIKN